MKEWQKTRWRRDSCKCNPIACWHDVQDCQATPGTCNSWPSRPLRYNAGRAAFRHQSPLVIGLPKRNLCIPPRPPVMHERNPYRVRKPDFAALAEKDEGLRPL